MASLHFLAAAIITTLLASSTLALPSNKPGLETAAISAAAAAPAPLLLSPRGSPYSSELPPDSAPLLPSPGGATPHPPTGSLLPTIPSSRSPPNPDSTGLDSEFAPPGLLKDSSAVSQNLVKELIVDRFLGFLAYWLLLVFIV